MNQNNNNTDEDDTGNSNLDQPPKILQAIPENISVTPGNAPLCSSPLIDPSILSVPSKRALKNRSCVCGSTTHLRRSHKACPLNPKRTKTASNLEGKTSVKQAKKMKYVPASALTVPLPVIDTTRLVGRCCLNEKCQYPFLELRPEHKCPICKQIVHTLCGVFNTQLDKYVCVECNNTNTEKVNAANALPAINVATATNIPPSMNTNNSINGTICGKCPENNTQEVNAKSFLSATNIPPAINVPPTTRTNSSIDNAENLLKPSFCHVGGIDNYTPVVDVDSKKFKPSKTIFRLYDEKNNEVPPTVENLVQHYFGNDMVENLVNSSNAYMYERKRREPNRACFKRTQTSKQFTAETIYHFIAILYYFGVVKLPSKVDYWDVQSIWMPSHPICNVNGMTRARFEFLWRHFHCNHSTAEDFEEIVDDSEELDDEELVETDLERVQHEQEDLERNEEAIENEITIEKKTWYNKIEPIVTHVRIKSLALIFTLGTFLAIDEMMVRFSGKSMETHRIKNKPISEGYKFFVLALTNGFVVTFTPDGRTAAKQDGKMDYDSKHKELGKVGSLVLHLAKSIHTLRKKQKDRIKRKQLLRTTRSRLRENTNEETLQNNFVITMDNYFTLPKVIKELRAQGIGVVGTAKYQRAWPPVKLKNIEDKSACFNQFFWTVDEHGTLVARWMDNGMVLCVSTVHSVGKMVEKNRRKPRKTLKNQTHVDAVWGSEGKKKIFIPTLIDDYNHWMGGVDLCDQHISYYHPNVRARRNWIPMFIQILSIIRSNAYICYKQYFQKNAISHKQFTLNMIDVLMQKSLQTNEMVQGAQTTPEPLHIQYSTPPSRTKTAKERILEIELNHGNDERSQKKQRNRLSKYIGLDSFPLRLDLPKSLHRRVKGKVHSRSSCVYCAMLYKQKENDGTEIWWKSVKRTNQMCYYCNEYLCRDHFDLFHEVTSLQF